uniref:Cytochrome c oxidase subunit 3 n=1 Tax=Schlettererius cinctipes TaxID=32424 RepID=C4NCG0_9HYME|nr:cytochrome c oxidase subunit III [Schlettererius cinctipes]
MTNFQPFHIVTISPWPVTLSISVFLCMIMSIKMLHSISFKLMLLISVISMIMCCIQWWRDVIREGTFQGTHTNKVCYGLRLGMILFILSEIMFFSAFFWTYFHSSLTPSSEIGMNWPPKGVDMINPYHLPLLNTIILLTSGMSITWAHHSLLNKMYTSCNKAIFLTIMLGMYFSMLQYIEFKKAPFTMSDSVYGSTFYLATGFHGIHVIIGTIFIFISFLRLNNSQFSSEHHFGFEAATWYWHFVDVIWLFLFISIYWWNF